METIDLLIIGSFFIVAFYSIRWVTRKIAYMVVYTLEIILAVAFLVYVWNQFSHIIVDMAKHVRQGNGKAMLETLKLEENLSFHNICYMVWTYVDILYKKSYGFLKMSLDTFAKDGLSYFKEHHPVDMSTAMGNSAQY